MSFIDALKNGNWLNQSRIRGYPRLFLCLYGLLGFLWIFGLQERLQPHEGAFVTDFINVYSAGLSVHEGHPRDAYDWENQKKKQDDLTLALSAEQDIKDNGFLPWLYPPMFLAVGWAVAFLPYFVALGLYSLIGLALYGLTLSRMAPPYKESLWVAAAFPGVFINLFSGQNGFFTTSLLAAGLFFLERFPVAAGIAFGALSYKPHFFVLIPLALLAARQWKALTSAVASACVFAALSWAAFGSDSWIAFYEGLPATKTNILEIDSDRWLGILHSVFSMVRVFGGNLQTAYAVQSLVTLSSILLVLWIWSKRVSFEVRGASLAALLLLASPYSFVYDQVLLAIPIALLAGKGIRAGFLPFEKTFLFALWLLPFLVQDSGKHFAMPLTPPMLILLLAFCWKRARAELSPFSPLKTGRSP